ncbi:MAG: hypothetical protein U1G05_18235 [Kiritimatiellia bacterium]
MGELFQVMRKLRGQGIGIVFVTHFLEQVYAVTDRITVLRNGRLVGEYATAGLSRLQLVGHMIGKDVEEVKALHQRPAAAALAGGAPFLEAAGVGPELDPPLRSLHPPRRGGGAGRPARFRPHRDRAAALRGGPRRQRRAEDQRRSRQPAQPARQRSPAASPSPPRTARPTASSRTCPSARTSSSPCRPARHLEAPASRQAAGAGRPLHPGPRHQDPGPGQLIRNLSGGNQQKVLLARWLATEGAAVHPGRAHHAASTSAPRPRSRS